MARPPLHLFEPTKYLQSKNDFITERKRLKTVEQSALLVNNIGKNPRIVTGCPFAMRVKRTFNGKETPSLCYGPAR